MARKLIAFAIYFFLIGLGFVKEFGGYNNNFFEQLENATINVDDFTIQMVIYLLAFFGVTAHLFFKQKLTSSEVFTMSREITPQKLIFCGSLFVGWVFLKKALFPILGLFMIAAGGYAYFAKKWMGDK